MVGVTDAFAPDDQVLFDEPPVERTGALGWAEPNVHWFTSITRPEAQASRTYANAAYRRFPDHDGGLKSRLRSEDDKVHTQALDELIIHDRLIASAEDVRYEEGGVGPDFRIYDRGELVASVEVLSLFGKQEWKAEQLSHARVADALNERFDLRAGWFVHFEISRRSSEPSRRGILNFVDQALTDLGEPPEDPEEALGPGTGYLRLPHRRYSSGPADIDFWFSPLKRDASLRAAPEGRIVATGPSIGGAVDAGLRLRSRLKAKAGARYELSEKPFLVVAGIHDSFCSDDQVEEALYGSQAVTLSVGPHRPVGFATMIRQADGLFGAGDGNTRVSAVATIDFVRTAELATAHTIIWEHPKPQGPWPEGLLAGQHRSMDDLGFPELRQRSSSAGQMAAQPLGAELTPPMTRALVTVSAMGERS